MTKKAIDIISESVSQRRKRERGDNAAYDSAIKTEEELASIPMRCDKYDAGKLLGLHPETVSRLAREGKLPGRIIGQRWVFSKKQLLALVEEG